MSPLHSPFLWNAKHQWREGRVCSHSLFLVNHNSICDCRKTHSIVLELSCGMFDLGVVLCAIWMHCVFFSFFLWKDSETFLQFSSCVTVLIAHLFLVICQMCQNVLYQNPCLFSFCKKFHDLHWTQWSLLKNTVKWDFRWLASHTHHIKPHLTAGGVVGMVVITSRAYLKGYQTSVGKTFACLICKNV